MALTLPYPDMVFVPLDILTAEEQNQLVGNIEFLANQFPLAASNIANGAIGSDQLAAGAVKSQNVDWSTISSSQLAEVSGGWVLLGEAEQSSGKSGTVSWTQPYHDLKFVCSGQTTAVGDVYVSPLSSSGSKLYNSGGVRLGASSDTVVVAQSETWDGNIMVINQTEVSMSYNIQGQSIRHTLTDWRNWQVWGSQNGNYSRSNFWAGRQNSGTETMGLRWETNGTFSNLYLAVWGRCPY